ncbi:cell division protein FtsQ/DivIB [Fulvivirga lutea]|uniref:Cell division protein FtsQ n=1 Tax=Fulvivirga lutea TaxID=2810512 RepID=A0A974WIY9_9BACT|nr:cell division protein FtsQ [Fulvivirga lutea]QSE99045.1 cell division protein FtsQ [Fulvivirga lutea]
MLKKLKIGKGVKVAVVSILMLSLISFGSRKQEGEKCQDIIIKLTNQQNNFFIDENDIMRMMTKNGEEVLLGTHFKDIKLKEIEGRVKTQKFIKKAEIYKDLKGNLLVNAELRRPFARILEPGKANGYVALDGAILPTSTKYTSRAVILSGSYMKEMMQHDLTETEEGQKIYELLQFIYNDKFWSAQIAQIDISKDLYVTLYPQVTKQIVEFGKPEDVKQKFKKLKAFYKKVLPQKGWNTYSRINLEYKDQVIAE